MTAPPSPLALARAALLAGDVGEALRQAEAAVAASPSNGAAYALRGMARQTAGLTADGLADLKQAVALSPGTPGFWSALVSAALQAGETDAADAALAEGLRLHSGDPKLTRLRAPVAAARGRHDLAHEAAALAADAEGASLSVRLAAARRAIAVSRYDEAEERLRSLAREAPDDPEVAVSLAEVLGFAGHTGEARAIADKALVASPAHEGLLTFLLSLSPPNDDVMRQAAAVLERGGNKALRLALCRAFLRRGDETAAISLRRAAASSAWDEAADRRWVAWAFAQAEAVTTGARPDPCGPVYLCGPARSGGTLLQTRLCARFEATSVGERGSLPAAFWQAGRERDAPRPLGAEALRALAEADRAGLRRQAGEGVTIDKTPPNGLMAGLIAACHPGGRFVRNSRDLVETALSIWFHPFPPAYGYADNLADIARYLSLHEEALDGWAQRGVEFIRVQHEDVARVPGRVDDLAAALSLRRRPQEAAVTAPTHSFAQVRTEAKPQRALYPRLRPYLTDGEVAALEALRSLQA